MSASFSHTEVNGQAASSPDPEKPRKNAEEACFPRFFDLAPELRLRILDLVCFSPGGIFIGLMPPPSPDCINPVPYDCSCTRVPLNLFLAHPILYREASMAYYGRNTFHLSFLSFPAGNGPPPALFFLLESPVSFALRRVVVHSTKLGKALEEGCLNRLQDLAIRGDGLALLEVRFHQDIRTKDGEENDPGEKESGTVKEQWLAANYGNRKNGPAQTLLRLLCDPGVRNARLLVEADAEMPVTAPLNMVQSRIRTVQTMALFCTRRRDDGNILWTSLVPPFQHPVMNRKLGRDEPLCHVQIIGDISGVEGLYVQTKTLAQCSSLPRYALRVMDPGCKLSTYEGLWESTRLVGMRGIAELASSCVVYMELFYRPNWVEMNIGAIAREFGGVELERTVAGFAERFGGSLEQSLSGGVCSQ